MKIRTLIVLLLLSSLFAAAQHPAETREKLEEQAKTPPPVPAQKYELTAADVGAFLDGIVPAQIKRDDIAGAVVVVLKDGQVLYARGYGYADVEKKVPVTADATLFRPGSVSKLFTWTAVMQQVEQGKLDLDADVNQYLDFRIPEAFGKPVTLRDIMTHTPGFEEAIKDLFVPDAARLMPLGEYLKNHVPRRIFPPGAVPAYSNYGTALAGYIVERVSGQKFDDYIAAHIFQPLGMERATFTQPLPAHLKDMMSGGYIVASKPAKDFEVVPAAPAGSLSAAGLDMARFILAHLQDGRLGEAQILQPATAQLMHTRQRGEHPQMNAMALGFYQEDRNGQRIIGHGGDTLYFHSDLHLMLDQGVGFFVSYNSGGKGQVSNRSMLWYAFLDRYFPYQPPAVPANAGQGPEVAGAYLVSRRSDDSLMAVLGRLGQTTVSKDDKGNVIIPDLKDFNGQPKKWQHVGNGLYREVGGQDRIAFNQDEQGRMQIDPGFPVFVFTRVGFFAGKSFTLFVLFASLGILLLAVVLWPVAAGVRWHYARSLTIAPGERRCRLLVRLLCIYNLAVFGAWTGLGIYATGHIGFLNSGLDPWLRLLQVLTWLAVLGTLLALYHAFRTWTSGAWWWTKVQETAIALACVGFSWLMLSWNLAGWSLKY